MNIKAIIKQILQTFFSSPNIKINSDNTSSTTNIKPEGDMNFINNGNYYENYYENVNFIQNEPTPVVEEKDNPKIKVHYHYRYFGIYIAISSLLLLFSYFTIITIKLSIFVRIILLILLSFIGSLQFKDILQNSKLLKILIYGFATLSIITILILSSTTEFNYLYDNDPTNGAIIFASFLFICLPSVELLFAIEQFSKPQLKNILHLLVIIGLYILGIFLGLGIIAPYIYNF